MRQAHDSFAIAGWRGCLTCNSQEMPAIVELPWLLLFRLGRKTEVCGVPVAVAADRPTAEGIHGRVREAMGLLQRSSLEHLDLVRNSLNRLLFTESPGSDYHHAIQTCRIGIAYALRVPALELAMTLVHEATHAKLAANGRRYVGQERERIERECVEEEIAFARRVPNSDAAIAKLQELLSREWWSDESYATSMTAELRSRGIPLWLATRLVRYSSRKLRRARAAGDDRLNSRRGGRE
jgi:hypothetical protein